MDNITFETKEEKEEKQNGKYFSTAPGFEPTTLKVGLSGTIFMKLL